MMAGWLPAETVPRPGPSRKAAKQNKEANTMTTVRIYEQEAPL